MPHERSAGGRGDELLPPCQLASVHHIISQTVCLLNSNEFVETVQLAN
jgi:hypothetical protein